MLNQRKITEKNLLEILGSIDYQQVKGKSDHSNVDLKIVHVVCGSGQDFDSK